MNYTKQEKIEIEKVRAVFGDYIRTSPCMDLVWSDKAGYLYLNLELTAGCPGELGTAPTFIRNAEMLCDRLFMEIVYDVINSSGKGHAPYEADEQERAEIERRLRPCLRQLPEYARLTKQLYAAPLYLQREQERRGPAPAAHDL